METMIQTNENIEWVPSTEAALILAKPVHVIPVQVQERIDRSVEEGLTIAQVDETNIKAVVEKMNFLGKHISWVEKTRIPALRKPYNEQADFITKEGREGIKLATRVYADLAQKIQTYNDAVEAERQRQIKEQQAREAEARRKAAEEEARKAQELAELNRQQLLAQQEAERKQLARQKAEAEEKARVEALTTDTIAATEDLFTATAATEQAALEEAEAQRKADELAEQARKLAETPVAPIVVHQPEIVGPVKVKGLSLKPEPIIDAIDKAKLPLTYLKADEVLIRKHLKDGLQISGVTWHTATTARATMRG
jgi:colicin import membrane protein